TTKQLSSGDEILRHVLDGPALRTALVGNTLRGEMAESHEKWAEYYTADGKISGKNNATGAYDSDYAIKGDQLCFRGSDDTESSCFTVSLIGNDVYFLSGTQVSTVFTYTTLAKGNPDNL